MFSAVIFANISLCHENARDNNKWNPFNFESYFFQINYQDLNTLVDRNEKYRFQLIRNYQS